MQHAEKYLVRRQPRIILTMRAPHLAGIAIEVLGRNFFAQIRFAHVHQLHLVFAAVKPPELLPARGTIHHITRRGQRLSGLRLGFALGLRFVFGIGH